MLKGMKSMVRRYDFYKKSEFLVKPLKIVFIYVKFLNLHAL